MNPTLHHVNVIWDRLQTTVFFVQETSLSIMYIIETRKFLHDTSFLHKSLYSLSSRIAADRRTLLHQLIYTNLLIIALDITLLGIQYADLFYLQGAFKPCVYGIKLKVEFVILNRLIKSVRAGGENMALSGGTVATAGQSSADSGKKSWWSRLVNTSGQREEARQVGLENLGEEAIRRTHSQGSQAPIIPGQSVEAAGQVGGSNAGVVH